MGHRLSKIYTKTGDNGTTGLTDGSRVKKSSPVIEVIGEVDELNSSIGLLASQLNEHTEMLNFIQDKLFDIGAEIATPGYSKMSETDLMKLEQSLDMLNEKLPPLKEFILPKGDLATCFCHMARSICRRAERRMVAYIDTQALNEINLKFINRLSDWLFVFARTLSKATHQPETPWTHDRKS